MAWFLTLIFLVLWVSAAVAAQNKQQELEQQRKALEDEVKRLSGRYSTLQREAASLQDRSARAHTALANKVDQQAAAHTAEKFNAETTLRGLETTLKDQQVAIQTAEQRAAAAEREIQRQESVITGLEATLKRQTQEIGALNTALDPYRDLIDIDAKHRAVTEQIRKKKTEVKTLNERITLLQQEVDPLDLESIARDFGLYEPKYSFDTSTRFKVELDRLRQTQKELIRQGKAVDAPVGWTINGNAALGRKMLKEIAQLQARAFNGESESLILKVRFDNVLKIEERLVDLWNKINVLDGETGSRLTSEFLELKLKELHLVHEYQEKKQAEAEEQRAIREQMREEERAQRELERAQAEAEREEQRYFAALEKARREVETAVGSKHDRLQAEIERLSAALAEAHEKGQRAISMAQQTRVGHVYVISNIGSFGENVYKIGMTRRLEPMDRVKELGDASVPFTFDVHAIIYSNDAPKLEADLHREFAARRVNQINLKKEFFNVTLEEIQDFVHRHHGDIEFTLAAEAADYRKTIAMQA